MDAITKTLFETGYTIITDTNGVIVEVSQSIEDLTGYESASMIGKHTRMFNSGFHPKSFFKDLWDTILSGKNWNGVIRNRTKLNDFIWVYTSIFPIKNDAGEIVNFLAIRSDVTYQKLLEQKLSESEEKLKEAQEITHIGSWKHDIITDELTWSDEVYNIFGVDSNSFQVNINNFLNLVKEDERLKVANTYYESIKNGTNYHINHQVIQPDGSFKTVEENARFYYDNDGVPVKTIGTIQDISERINRQIAEEKVKERETMIHEINHRTKNNIQIISSLLSLHATKSKSNEVKEALNEARDRVNTIAQLHDTLYQSSDFGEIVLENHFSKLIENLIKVYNKENKDIQYSVVSEIAKLNLKKVVPLALILNELVTNSLKYAFINSNEGKIKLVIQKKNNEFIMTYSDNGTWIDQTPESGNGTKLIDVFFKQLYGICEINKENGTKYTFTFPI